MTGILIRRVKRQKPFNASLARRGPDQSGFFCSGHCTLIHNRLSVIDPENGRQLMTLEAKGKRCTIVYNGELYNTAELRHTLAQRGWRFQTHSDTEVLLASFIEWGARLSSPFKRHFRFRRMGRTGGNALSCARPHGCKTIVFYGKGSYVTVCLRDQRNSRPPACRWRRLTRRALRSFC